MDIPVKVSLYRTGAQPYKTLRYEIPNESASSVRDAALYGAGYAESGDRIVVWSGYRNEKLGTFKRGTVAGLPSVSKIARKKKSNPRGTMKRATKSKSRAASRYGVYVGSSLAYVSTKKLDANKAASKLKLSGRTGIKIKAVGPNPISGKVPAVGWRTQYKKAAFAAVKAPGARRKRAATTGKIRRALNSSGTYYFRGGGISLSNARTGRLHSARSLNLARKKAKELARSFGMREVQIVKGRGGPVVATVTRNSAISIVGPSRARRVVKTNPKRKRATAGRKRNAASILMRRANPGQNPARAKSRVKTSSTPRTRYMVQVGETPAWVGKLKSDANKAWKKLNAAGLKGLKIFKVQVNKVVKDGWRKAYKSAASVSKSRNPGKKYYVRFVDAKGTIRRGTVFAKNIYEAEKAAKATAKRRKMAVRSFSISASASAQRSSNNPAAKRNPPYPWAKYRYVVSTTAGPGRFTQHSTLAIARRKAKQMARKYGVVVKIFDSVEHRELERVSPN